MEQPQDGVTWLGRIPQRQLWQEIATSNMWCYPTNFTETSCINCMEAQALGAIPIFHPLWALRTNVAHGALVEGDAERPDARARYISAILRLVGDIGLCGQIRRRMQPWALEQFDWEHVVDQYERWMQEC
jgi:hypothetical protein